MCVEVLRCPTEIHRDGSFGGRGSNGAYPMDEVTLGPLADILKGRNAREVKIFTIKP